MAKKHVRAIEQAIVNRRSLEEGQRLAEEAPFVGYGLGGRIQVVGRKDLGTSAAVTISPGMPPAAEEEDPFALPVGKKRRRLLAEGGRDKPPLILLNRDCELGPEQWAWVIAHCWLHLALGHFDAANMPGHAGTDGKREGCDFMLWNAACDIAVAKFLADARFGEPLAPNGSGYRGRDARAIYDGLSEKRAAVRDLLLEYGAARPRLLDMRGMEYPVTYGEGREEGEPGPNPFAADMARAVAESARWALDQAAGRDRWSGERLSPAREAARWFVTHYPLLGGLADGFSIVEESRACAARGIEMAAVDVEAGAIYINPERNLDELELRFVLAREYLHAGLQHHRRRQGREPFLWNVACDFVINGWLHEMGVGRMPEGVLHDPALKGKTAEGIYEDLARDLKRGETLALVTPAGRGRPDILGGGWAELDGEPLERDAFYKSALQNGLEYHQNWGRGLVPAGLAEAIRALAVPPVPWDVELGDWLGARLEPPETRRTYARASRRQGSTPNIPRPGRRPAEPPPGHTFGVVVDTSGSMSPDLIGLALGAIASFAAAREVPRARVVFCDAAAYDAGWLSPADIADVVEVRGRGGTALQPGVDLLETADDFPPDAPILIITDAGIEPDLRVKREHAFLVPLGGRLPFKPRGEVFHFPRKLER